MSQKPHLLVDVDGVLNPLSFWVKHSAVSKSADWVGHDIFVPSEGRSFLVHLNQKLHRPMFERLSEHFTFMWATTWDVNANKFISPRLGLPPWGIVPMCNSNSAEYKEYYGGNYAWSPLYSKTKPIALWAREYGIERFAWIDDQPNTDDQQYFDGLGLDAKIFFIEPTDGLTLEHEAALVDWAKEKADV